MSQKYTPKQISGDIIDFLKVPRQYYEIYRYIGKDNLTLDEILEIIDFLIDSGKIEYLRHPCRPALIAKEIKYESS